MALNLAPEDRFALDVYSDPTLSIDEKLARLRAYGADAGGMAGADMGAAVTGGIAPANDLTAPPVNDNGLPAIPAGPGIPVEATALGGVDAMDSIGKFGPGPAPAPPAQPPAVPDVPIGPPVAPAAPFDFTQVRQFERGPLPSMGGRSVPSVHGVSPPASAYDAPPAAAGPSPAEQAALAAAEAARNPGAAKPSNVDPSQVQFADGSAAPSAANAPIYAQVGTDTFQPASRTIRAGITPTIPIAGGEPEFGVDEKGNLTITGEPPQETPIEPLITSAEQDELGAKRDIQEAQDYREAASLRADQAAEERARKIEEDNVRRANERMARLRQKEDDYQRVLREVTDPDSPQGADAYFAKEGTPGRFAAGLAIAFGELGAALRGTTQNTARDIIFKAIDDEIQAGRERRAARIKGAETAYDLARDQFQTESLQDAAVKEMMLGRVAREAARFKQFAQTPERKAAVDEQIAFWESQQLKAAEERQRLMQDEIVQQERFDPVRTVQVGGSTGKDEGREIYSNGELVGWAPNDGRAEKVQPQVDSLDHIHTQLGELAQLTEEAKGNLNPQKVDDLKKRISSKINLIGAAMSVAQGQGAMSDDERKKAADSLGTAQDFFNFDLDSTPRVRQSIGYFGAKRDSVLRNNVKDAPKGGRPYRGGKMPGSFQGTK